MENESREKLEKKLRLLAAHVDNEYVGVYRFNIGFFELDDCNGKIPGGYLEIRAVEEKSRWVMEAYMIYDSKLKGFTFGGEESELKNFVEEYLFKDQ